MPDSLSGETPIEIERRLQGPVSLSGLRYASKAERDGSRALEGGKKSFDRHRGQGEDAANCSVGASHYDGADGAVAYRPEALTVDGSL